MRLFTTSRVTHRLVTSCSPLPSPRSSYVPGLRPARRAPTWRRLIPAPPQLAIAAIVVFAEDAQVAHKEKARHLKSALKTRNAEKRKLTSGNTW